MVKLLAAGICSYGNPRGLKRTLESLDGITDVNIVIHAKYPSFDLQVPDSLARSQEVCSRYSNTILTSVPHHPNHDEIYCRNLYLRMACDYDFLLVIDDDEYIAADESERVFRENLQGVKEHLSQFRIFDIDYEDPVLGIPVHRPRLFQKPGTIEYEGRHFWFKLTDRGKYNRIVQGASDCRLTVRGITMYQDSRIRSREHELAMDKYALWQNENQK